MRTPPASAIRIGLDSGTKIVLFPHPLANPSTTTAHAIHVNIRIDSGRSFVDAPFDEAEERKRELSDDSIKHFSRCLRAS